MSPSLPCCSWPSFLAINLCSFFPLISRFLQICCDVAKWLGPVLARYRIVQLLVSVLVFVFLFVFVFVLVLQRSPFYKLSIILGDSDMRQYLFLHQGVLEKHWPTSRGRWLSLNLRWQITISGGRFFLLDHLHIFPTLGYFVLWSQVFRGTLPKLFLRRLTHGCFSPLMISGALIPKKIHSLFLLMCRLG